MNVRALTMNSALIKEYAWLLLSAVTELNTDHRGPGSGDVLRN